jgi:hypothetical protein
VCAHVCESSVVSLSSIARYISRLPRALLNCGIYYFLYKQWLLLLGKQDRAVGGSTSLFKASQAGYPAQALPLVTWWLQGLTRLRSLPADCVDGFSRDCCHLSLLAWMLELHGLDEHK